MLIQGLYYERIKKFETWYCYYWEIPHNYLNIDNIDKDNTLFDNNDENNEKKEIVLVDNILIMLIWKVKMIKMMNRKNRQKIKIED